ncbi:MAG: WD40 repeat domain-containing protein [Pseudomonadota bacterium]
MTEKFPQVNPAGHPGMVLATCFDHSGERLYSVSIDGTIHAWDVANGECEDVWRCHDGPINDLKYVNGHLFTAGHDRSVAILDAHNVQEIMRLTGHSMGVHSVAVSNSLVASGSADNRIGIWNRANGEHLTWLTGHEDAVTCLAFLNEDTLISGSRDRSLRLWDLGARRPIGIFRSHQAWVVKVAALDEHRAVSLDEDGVLKLWDWQSDKELWSLKVGSVAWGLGVDPAGHFAITSGSATLIVDIQEGSFRRIDQQPTARGIGIHPKGELAAFGGGSGEIRLYDLREHSYQATLAGASANIVSASVGPDEQVLGLANGNVEVIAKSAKRTIASAHSHFVYATRRIDQARFVTGAFDGAVRIWRFNDLELLAELDHGALVFSLSMPSDLSCLLSGGDEYVKLWDLVTGRCIWQAEQLGDHVMAAIDREGRQVVAADTALYVWRVSDWEKKVWPLTGEMVSSIEFLPDCKHVAIGYANGQVAIMNVDNGAYRLLHNEHEDWLRTLRVSSDGGKILSVSQNGIGRVYQLSEQQIISKVSAQPVAVADFDKNGQVHWVSCFE